MSSIHPNIGIGSGSKSVGNRIYTTTNKPHFQACFPERFLSFKIIHKLSRPLLLFLSNFMRSVWWSAKVHALAVFPLLG